MSDSTLLLEILHADRSRACCHFLQTRRLILLTTPESGTGRPDASEQRIISESCRSLCIFAENTRHDPVPVFQPNHGPRIDAGGTRTLVPDADGFIFRPSIEAALSLSLSLPPWRAL